MSRRRIHPAGAAAGALPPDLVGQVLQRLGLPAAPEPDLDGLRRLYGAWCRRVPFDNVRKLIHLYAGDRGPLPGDDAVDFFRAWLRHGTGGTCWAGNGALQTLLRTLRFDARRGLGTMLVAPNLPPNHGTVIVALEGHRYLVDASILHAEPLPLEERAATRIVHGAWGVRCERRARHWFVHWRALHAPQGIDCRIEKLRTSARDFQQRHERSRPWSPFNFSLYARALRGDAVTGIAFGRRIEFDATGQVRESIATAAERTAFLVERLGMDPALLARLPPDRPLPPPPAAATGPGQRVHPTD
ncbi:MAG TPA: arylamine N-acetyltransferase [Steroidobacteraceae bacterium]|jgi:N-hydroxyarylamine O-acetyltransferase